MPHHSNHTVSLITNRDAVVDLLKVGFPGLITAPFQSPHWLKAWFETFPPEGDTQAYLAVMRNTLTGAPEFVLPLIREEIDGLWVLTVPDRGVADYQGALFSPELAANPQLFVELWRQLLKQLPAADLLLIEKVLPEVCGHDNPLAHLGSARHSQFNRHPLRLDADYQTLEATRFDGSCIRSLARKRRRLHNRGKLVFACESGSATLDAATQVLVWREARFASTNSAEKSARDRRFFLNLAGQSAIARMLTLRLDGQLISGCLGTEVGGGFQMLALAHDTAWNNWSPGLLVIEDTIRWASARGLTEYDFTIGDESYKTLFGTCCEGLLEIQEAMSLKGIAYIAYKRSRRFAGKLLRRAGGSIEGARSATRALLHPVPTADEATEQKPGRAA